MSAAGIAAGDLVIASLDKNVLSGEIAVIEVEGGERYIKRVFFETHSLRLQSESFEKVYKDHFVSYDRIVSLQPVIMTIKAINYRILNTY